MQNMAISANCLWLWIKRVSTGSASLPPLTLLEKRRGTIGGIVFNDQHTREKNI